MWIRAREIGNKKKKKKEEDNQWVSCKTQKKKGSHLEEKKKLSMFASVGPTNFDIFTIGRKKKRVFLIWCHCKKEFLMCTFNL